MTKGYAYLDQYEILHVVSDEQTAKDYSGNGKVEEIDFAHGGGYPTIKVNGKDESLIVYTDGQLREKNNRQIPGYIKELVGRLKG